MGKYAVPEETEEGCRGGCTSRRKGQKVGRITIPIGRAKKCAWRDVARTWLLSGGTQSTCEREPRATEREDRDRGRSRERRESTWCGERRSKGQREDGLEHGGLERSSREMMVMNEVGDRDCDLDHADSAKARARRRVARIQGHDDDTPLRPPVFDTPSPQKLGLLSGNAAVEHGDHEQGHLSAPPSNTTDVLASARSDVSRQVRTDSDEAASHLHALEVALREAARLEVWRERETKLSEKPQKMNEADIDADVEAALAARLERLGPIVADVESGEVGTASALAGELANTQTSNLELTWELLWQTAQTQRSATALIAARGKLADQCTRPELRRKVAFLETARAKCASMQAQCLLDTYGRGDQQEALEHMSASLDEAVAKAEEENAAVERKLEELKLLPPGLVREYDELQAAISERRDYIRRLEEGSA